MQNFEVKTPVRGLPRADGQRRPVGIGEVVALSVGVALDLLDMDAVVPTDADVTIDLDWSSMEDRLLPPIAVVAVTDRHALVDAIGDLGGLVFFVGEGLPDQADDVLVDFPNDALLDELSARVGEGRLGPALLSGIVSLDGSADAEPAEEANAQPAAGMQPVTTVSPVETIAAGTAQEKPVRKAKAAAK
jgi:hypothetical protein